MEIYGVKAIGSIPPGILAVAQLVMAVGKLVTETEMGETIGQQCSAWPLG
jgi:hypothetical protein